MFAWIVALAFAAQVPPPRDCGERRYAHDIAHARRLAIYEAGLTPYVGEIPTASGHFECARLTFNIDPRGRASNIDVAESSGDSILVMDARRTLQHYRFTSQAPDASKRYTLVFSGVVNKAPSFP